MNETMLDPFQIIVGLFRGHIRLNVVNGQERAK